MGIYLNSDDTDFRSAVKYSRIYVDKTELILFCLESKNTFASAVHDDSESPWQPIC